LLQDREELLLSASGPNHLSYSRISRYAQCPEQYRFYYVVGLRPKAPGAALVFGQFLHQALAHLFQHQGDPVAYFQEFWQQIKDAELSYSARDNWATLKEKGTRLIERFIIEAVPRLETVEASEKPFELAISGLDRPFVGIIDLLAMMDGKRTIIDFKSAAASYEDYEVILNDQLTAYLMAESQAQQCAFCVLVKTKEPKIQWHFAERDTDRILRYLHKVELIGRAIERRQFYQRPGKWCAWCDFLPLCLGQQDQTLKQFVCAQ
jgi:ATP-dependent helicase/DNAse subunit B